MSQRWEADYAQHLRLGRTFDGLVSRRVRIRLQRLREMAAMRPAADRDLHRQGGTAGARGLDVEAAHQGVRAQILDRLSRSPQMNVRGNMRNDVCSDRSSETAARVTAFLDSHHVLSLATVGPDGPHAANLFYVRDGHALLWVSDPTSRHSLHLESRRRVASDCSDYSRINGVQVFGDADKIVDAADSERSRRWLERRFSFLSDLDDALAPVREAYRRAAFYRLTPSRVVLIDNSRGFGFKEAVDFRSSLDDSSRHERGHA